jgi:hypothetical protein
MTCPNGYSHPQQASQHTFLPHSKPKASMPKKESQLFCATLIGVLTPILLLEGKNLANHWPYWNLEQGLSMPGQLSSPLLLLTMVLVPPPHSLLPTQL